MFKRAQAVLTEPARTNDEDRVCEDEGEAPQQRPVQGVGQRAAETVAARRRLGVRHGQGLSCEASTHQPSNGTNRADGRPFLVTISVSALVSRLMILHRIKGLTSSARQAALLPVI